MILKKYFNHVLQEIGIMTKMLLKHYTDGMRVPNTDFRFQMLMS